MICSALTASELVLWIWNWQEESLTIKAETWKCKHNCFKDIRAVVSLIWTVYKCTVILPTHHSHNFNREPESIVMEISNDKFKDQSSILVSCLDMMKIWLLVLLWCERRENNKEGEIKLSFIKLINELRWPSLYVSCLKGKEKWGRINVFFFRKNTFLIF